MKKFRQKTDKIYKIRLHSNRSVENAYRAYQTSWETEALKSEQCRQIYSELIELENEEKLEDLEILSTVTNHNEITRKIDDDESDDETPNQQITIKNNEKWWTKFTSLETTRPKLLKEIALETFGRNFRKGKIDERIYDDEQMQIGNLIDIELPILNLLDINNEFFWRKLVKTKMKNLHKFLQISRDLSTNWKEIGIELKLKEIIENISVSDFHYSSTFEKFQTIVEGVKNYVKNLEIEKLQPKLTANVHPSNPTLSMVRIPSENCQHISLEFLGILSKLKSLSLKFHPEKLGENYERRFFQVSVQDIENLNKALMKLQDLEKLKISADLSECDKVRLVFEPLIESVNLKILNLPFCKIQSLESAKVLETFLELNSTLEEFELKGNQLDYEFCACLGFGLRKFKGKLKYLGVSLNKILGNGLNLILKSIQISKNVVNLDISQCESYHAKSSMQCYDELANLLKTHSGIKKIDFHANQIDTKNVKEKLIQSLNQNYEIEDFICDFCDFSINQRVKIKVLLTRNQFYRENPILKKENFTSDDEIEIEKFLRRTKNPILLKVQSKFK